MPTVQAEYPCPYCDETRPSPKALGAHKRHAHPGMAAKKGPKHPQGGVKSLWPSNGDTPIISAQEAGYPPRTPGVPSCATCIARASDVEKGLIVVLIRAGMSIERAQKTVQQMRAVFDHSELSRVLG